jgi:hypothetical protein
MVEDDLTGAWVAAKEDAEEGRKRPRSQTGKATEIDSADGFIYQFLS